MGGQHVKRLRAAAVVLAALVGVSTITALNAGASPVTSGAPIVVPKHHKQKAVCGQAPVGVAHCDAHMQTQDDGVTPADTTSPAAGSYGPADLQSAYSLPSATAGGGQTVGIVDAYDQPNVEADLAAYRSQYGLPPCTSSGVNAGCFRKVNQNGNTSPLPTADAGWGQEIALDVEMVSAVCPNCHIVLVEANSANFSDLNAAENTAARMANAVSNSWGGSEFGSETFYDSNYNHPGVAITVSSGDSGYGVEFPASSKYVTAVGGTSLTRSATSRGWTETAWSGAGSGCSQYESKPTWQTDTGCSKRTITDVSAVADPNTGVAVYDSYGSGGANWFVFGGTSVASPIIASTYALGGNTAAVSNASILYSHRSSLWDVISGSTGSCGGSYLCTAKVGFDGPTGLGTPNGTVAFGGTAGGAATTTSTTSPSTTSTTSPSTTSTTAPPTTTSTSTSTTTSTTMPPTGGQLVANGGFETGAFSPWVVGGGAPTPVLVAGGAHGGTYSARLGTPSGPEPRGDSWVYQTVTVPSSASKATLSFWYWPATMDSVWFDWQTAQVRNSSGTTLATIFKTASNTRQWTLKTFDLTPYRGQTIQLWFDVHEDGFGDLTEMFLDDVAVNWS